MYLRLMTAACLAALASLSPAAAASGNGFEAISATLKTTLADSGARGDALFIGNKDSIFYVETSGKADFGTPVRLAPKSSIAELMLMLSLADSGFFELDDPARKYLSLDKASPFAKTTIRGLMIARASGGKLADRAAKTLMLVAESATARPWNSLFEEWIAKPLTLAGTGYPKSTGLSKAMGAREPAPTLSTNVRDYARLLSVLANGGRQNGIQILSASSAALVFQPQLIGSGSCARKDESGACTVVEQDVVGLYAWVDRARGLYGVLAASGSEISVAKAGRAIRAQAETIIDRDQAGAGLTSAIKRKAHSTGR
ncbi:MAG: serine hydrolase domain-containing protein [Alphaproteobacteria bacterium]